MVQTICMEPQLFFTTLEQLSGLYEIIGKTILIDNGKGGLTVWEFISNKGLFCATRGTLT